MSADSSSVFELIRVQPLLIWAVAEVVLTCGWLILQQRIPSRWYLFIQLIRLCAIPYFALLLGQISPRAMGLAGYDWSNSLSIGSLLIFSFVGVWFGIRLTEEANSIAQEEQSNLNGIAMTPGWSLNGLMFLTAGSWELNWSFWRVVFTQIVVVIFSELQSPIYWGVTLAILFAMLTIFLSSLSSVARITNIAILIATSVLFLFTRNFWLCWLLHGILQLTAMPETRSRH